MSIKAIFPAGVTALTVNGLHQWDYGRKLEIHADDLPAIIEVHFACPGMTEAVVRACAVVDGVAETTIPDVCLEQAAPITAWVYAIEDNTGFTVKTLTLNITGRVRPKLGEEVPTKASDKYTEAVSAMNEQVQAITEGRVTAAKAIKAQYADEALHASKAQYADEALHASKADEATLLRNEDVVFGRKLLWAPGTLDEGVITTTALDLTLPLNSLQSYIVIEYLYQGTLESSTQYNRASIGARTTPIVVVPDFNGSNYVDVPIYWHDGFVEFIRVFRRTTTEFKFMYTGTLNPAAVQILSIYLEY